VLITLGLSRIPANGIFLKLERLFWECKKIQDGLSKNTHIIITMKTWVK
jgi:hypothetical protein